MADIATARLPECSIDQQTSISTPTGGGGSPATVRVIIVVAVLISLWPVVGNGFGGFDDDMNVARNALLNPPRFGALRTFWTTSQHDLYVPFSYTVWWGTARVAYDPQLATPPLLNPHIFHLLNLLLHVMSALAAFEVLRRCVPDSRLAGIGALVFALHPMQIEAVAWISGTKDVLAGLLALVALCGYLRATDDIAPPRRRVAWLISTIAFMLAMLSKPGAVMLPLIAWILEVGVLRRPLRAATIRAIPWLVLAIPCVIWTRIIQPAPYSVLAIPMWQRPIVALDALSFYLRKLAFPLPLGVDYGRTPLAVLRGPSIWLTPVAVLLVAALVFVLRRKSTVPLAGFGIFVAALLPVLGLVPFDFQLYSTVADHYLYLAMLGTALFAAWLLGRWSRRVAMIGGIVLIITLSMLSNLQARSWKDATTIFTQALKVNPQSWIAHRQIAEELAAKGEVIPAIDYARRAVELNPLAQTAHITLASKLVQAGRLDDAIAAYREALALDPRSPLINTNLANLLAAQWRYDEAISHYQAALTSDPSSAIAHANLASVYEETGQFQQAAVHYEAALRLNPQDLNVRSGLARVRSRLRQ